MKLWLHKVEKAVDFLIGPCILVLFAVIIIEFFFVDFANQYMIWLDSIDYTIFGIFVADVIFKYIRIRPFKRFLKESWIDILAIFPFGLLFRAFEGLFNIIAATEVVSGGQQIVHEAVLLEREASTIVNEVEKTGKVSRTSVFARLVKPITKAPRFLKAFTFHEKPTGYHHPHDKEYDKNYHKRNLKKKKSRK